MTLWLNHCRCQSTPFNYCISMLSGVAKRIYRHMRILFLTSSELNFALKGLR